MIINLYAQTQLFCHRYQIIMMTRTRTRTRTCFSLNSAGLWQKVKNVFSNDESDSQLPSYDDLFPFGPSSFHLKPKSSVERSLNSVDDDSNGDSSKVITGTSRDDNQEDAGVSSDSSEDMVISYINHPRKNVENDKMLLFFLVPSIGLYYGIIHLRLHHGL